VAIAMAIAIAVDSNQEAGKTAKSSSRMGKFAEEIHSFNSSSNGFKLGQTTRYGGKMSYTKLESCISSGGGGRVLDNGSITRVVYKYQLGISYRDWYN
jgi:hypothetical protein